MTRGSSIGTASNATEAPGTELTCTGGCQQGAPGGETQTPRQVRVKSATVM